jgi:hypothetical protein
MEKSCRHPSFVFAAISNLPCVLTVLHGRSHPHRAWLSCFGISSDPANKKRNCGLGFFFFISLASYSRVLPCSSGWIQNEKKLLASFDNREEAYVKRHITRFVEKAGFEPRTLGTKAECYDHCATRRSGWIHAPSVNRGVLNLGKLRSIQNTT